MIVEEILAIYQDRFDDGTRLNEIVDGFRDGRDISEIMALLENTDARLVSIGAWILGEIPYDLYSSDAIVSKLWTITEHSDPLVRFHALGALFPALDRNSTATQTLLRKLLVDENEGVRISADAALKRLSLS